MVIARVVLTFLVALPVAFLAAVVLRAVIRRWRADREELARARRRVRILGWVVDNGYGIYAPSNKANRSGAWAAIPEGESTSGRPVLTTKHSPGPDTLDALLDRIEKHIDMEERSRDIQAEEADIQAEIDRIRGGD
jgi:hypothetical protein